MLMNMELTRLLRVHGMILDYSSAADPENYERGGGAPRGGRLRQNQQSVLKDLLEKVPPPLSSWL